MKPTTPGPTSDHSTTPMPVFGPAWVLFVIAACAVVMTGHSLGGAWLSEPSLGLPAGLWIVAAVGGVSWLTTRGTRRADERPVRALRASAAAPIRAVTREDDEVDDAAPSEPAAETTPEPVAETTDHTTEDTADDTAAGAPSRPARAPASRIRSTWPDSLIPSAGLNVLSGLARTFEGPGGSEGGLISSLAGWMDGRQTPTRPLRVGVMLDDWAFGTLSEGGASDVEWMVSEETTPLEAMRRGNLDAVVAPGAEGADTMVVRTREHSAKEAAWFDWGAERPISYFSVFPMRMDPNRVTLPGLLSGIERRDPAAAESARRMIRLAALCGRYPARLTLADRISGRTSVPRGGGGLDLTADAFREAAGALGGSRTAADRIAARVASAWIATAPDTLNDDQRCELADRVVRVCGDEAEVLLRVAAVRLAMLDENLGIDALVRADRMIRQRGTIEGLDHIRLLQAELEHGTFGGMTIGRVAAGVCLACAVTPADRIAFLKDDLVDDFRLSSWLVGRDKEHAMLLTVFRELERNRRADAFGLPAANAA